MRCWGRHATSWSAPRRRPRRSRLPPWARWPTATPRPTRRHGTSHPAIVGEALDALEHRGNGAHRAPVPLAAPLSDREQAILRYLPTMMSNQEIAGELYVSVNTVKTHLKAIYRKRDAPGRHHAVERGRELGLMP